MAKEPNPPPPSNRPPAPAGPPPPQQVSEDCDEHDFDASPSGFPYEAMRFPTLCATAKTITGLLSAFDDTFLDIFEKSVGLYTKAHIPMLEHFIRLGASANEVELKNDMRLIEKAETVCQEIRRLKLLIREPKNEETNG